MNLGSEENDFSVRRLKGWRSSPPAPSVLWLLFFLQPSPEEGTEGLEGFGCLFLFVCLFFPSNAIEYIGGAGSYMEMLIL